MIKIGVTGSNGFIGWHLSRTLELHTNKFELIDFHRDWFNDSIKLDLFVSNCDIIVHLAGLNRHIEERTIYETNVALAVKLVDSFKRTVFKGQLIFSSSIQEDRNNTFGDSKKVARELFANWAKQSGATFHGVIIPNVFGAFGIPFYNSVISTLLPASFSAREISSLRSSSLSGEAVTSLPSLMPFTLLSSLI